MPPSPLTPYQLKQLNLLCRTVASEKPLLRWFDGLAVLPANLRSNAIIQITSEMRRNSEDSDVIGAVCSLSDRDVYAAAVEAIAKIRR